jgi:hypothetical protein
MGMFIFFHFANWFFCAYLCSEPNHLTFQPKKPISNQMQAPIVIIIFFTEHLEQATGAPGLAMSSRTDLLVQRVLSAILGPRGQEKEQRPPDLPEGLCG